MQLFKEKVYRRLKQTQNLNRGIEEALTHIIDDTALQTAIRDYARANEICHKGYGEYGTGVSEFCGRNNTFKDRRIIFWSRKSPICKKHKDESKDELYIGPDPEKEIMPMYLCFWTLNDEPEPWAPELVYTNIKIQEKEQGKFYLEQVNSDSDSIDMQRRREIAGRRVIDVPFLHGRPASEFLTGLEKALVNILNK